jgi:hypothetical protein
MTTGIQCKVDPQCKVPAPSETGICHCHAAEAGRGSLLLQCHLDLAREPGRAEAEPELEAGE